MSRTPPIPPPPVHSSRAPRQRNVPAVASLITGILSFIPLVSVAAVILGSIGLLKSNKPNMAGMGMSIAGLMLGVIGLAWTVGFAIIAFRGKETLAADIPAKAMAQQFASDIGKRDVDAATRDCSIAVNSNRIRSIATQAAAWGPLQGTTLSSFHLVDAKGLRTAKVSGTATFENVQKSYSVTLDLEDGAYRVLDFNFADPTAATQP